MKRNKLCMQLAVLMVMTCILAACTNEELPIDQPQTGKKATIRAGIAKPKETRMSVTDTGTFNAENLELKWETGDSFDVYEGNTVKATFIIENATDISEDGKSATFTYNGEGEVPTVENGMAYFGEANSGWFKAPVQQSATDTRLFNEKKLPMKAEGISIGPGTTTDITFEHMSYVLKFSFRLAEGSRNPEVVTLESSNSDALATTYNTASNKVTFSLDNYEFNGRMANFNVYIPLFPRTDGIGNLTVTISGGGIKFATFGPTASGTDPFEAGKIYSAKIAFDEVGVGSLVETSEFSNSTTAETYSGNGEVSNPYIIASAGNLKRLIIDTQAGNNFAGKYVKLTTDIHVTADTWTPLGNSDRGFWGNFDGNAHSITGTLNLSNDNSGFFGEIYNNTNEIEIKNLTVAANITSIKETIGGIIGYICMENYNCETVTIENCHFVGNLTASSNAGGIIGYINSYEDIAPEIAVKVENCTSRGSITSYGTGNNYDNIGGIIGCLSEKCIINACANYAKITGNHPENGQIGGIAGYTMSNIGNCINYGEIDGVGSIGGILGCLGYYDLTFSNNKNYGKIGNPTATLVGGIAGDDYFGNSYTNNANYSEDIAGSSYVGGLWGERGDIGDPTITGNINNTSVPSKGTNGVPYP